MTNHQHRILCNRPLNQIKQLGGTTARRKFFSNLVVTSERQRSLLSPARRAEQTALALGRNYEIREELAPGCSAAQLLDLVQWPVAKDSVLVVGHQPTLGQTIAQLIGLSSTECPVKKGALWWLRNRQHQALSQ